MEIIRNAINYKVELSLKWYETCLLTDAKLYVPIVTLTVEDNSKLSKLLSERFKRSIYWNEYKVTPNKIIQAVKVLIDYLFLPMIIQQVIIKFLLIHMKNTFFQKLK